jgi:hypothetical protein
VPGGLERDPAGLGVLGGERRDGGGQDGEPVTFGRVGADVADQGVQAFPRSLNDDAVDRLGAAHLVLEAQRGADGGAADPVGAALVAEQVPVATRPGRALPVPAGRHRARAGDDDHARGAEEGAGPGAVRIAGDVHRATRLPGQGLAEVACLARWANPGQADARGPGVGGLDDMAEVPGEAVGEQRVHRRARRADGDRAVLEQDDAGSAAAGVDAEDPAGQAASDVAQGAAHRGGGGAWPTHSFTLVRQQPFAN